MRDCEIDRLRQLIKDRGTQNSLSDSAHPMENKSPDIILLQKRNGGSENLPSNHTLPTLKLGSIVTHERASQCSFLDSVGDAKVGYLFEFFIYFSKKRSLIDIIVDCPLGNHGNVKQLGTHQNEFFPSNR